MAIHETEERNGKLRTVMKLEPGERVALCRCMRSADFRSAMARTKPSRVLRVLLS